MEYIVCSHDEIKKYKNTKGLSLGWDMLSDKPYKIEHNNEIVALIDFSIGGYYGDNSIEIDNFEVFEKGQGVGEQIISSFLACDKVKIVALYPENNKCYKFWVRLGFEPVYEDPETIRLVYRK